MADANWTDALGNNYPYSIHGIDAEWNDVDGNYIFTHVKNGLWVPLYIGQGNFKTRLTKNHECWLPAVRRGATHVHAHVNADAAKRLLEERRLIQTHNPVLNTQHRVA